MSNILITGARAPVALHLSRLFHAAGHRVTLADSHRFPLSRRTRSATYLQLPAPRNGIAQYAAAVEAVVRERRIDLVVPTCEEVFFLAAARDLHGRAIPLFAPTFAVLARAHNKASFASDAVGFGADPAHTDLAASPEELAAIGNATQRVLKPAWSRFASRVLIRPTAQELRSIVPTAADPWVVQDFLPGEELCGYGVAAGGRLLAFAAYRPLYRSGLGAGIAFEPVDEPVARTFAAGYAASTAWTGQLSFDFRRDAAGQLHVIECNPRAVSGLHFFGPGDGLPAAILEGGESAATDRRGMTVPLAMVVYGLLPALRSGTLPRWWRDYRRMGNVLALPGDKSVGMVQLLALGEIALLALRSGKSLQQAATHDLEWNGEPLG